MLSWGLGGIDIDIGQKGHRKGEQQILKGGIQEHDSTTMCACGFVYISHTSTYMFH